jgi:hypothetical protein
MRIRTCESACTSKSWESALAVTIEWGCMLELYTYYIRTRNSIDSAKPT